MGGLLRLNSDKGASPNSPGAHGSTAVSQGLSTSLSPESVEAPPKPHAVPHGVEVLVTGARPGRSSENRELFNETTTTVLVFENGAVIRLGAAVQTGQLLFVTHLKFDREVVAQVMRKRDSRPSSCYVELEFTEPFPDFWGVKFPKVPDPASITLAQKEAKELVRASEMTEDSAGIPASTPSSEEVAVLRQEVEALRKRLQFEQTQRGAGEVSPPAAAEPAGNAGVVKEDIGYEPEETLQVTMAPGILAAAARSEDHQTKATIPEITPEEEVLLPRVALKFGPAPTAPVPAKTVETERPMLQFPRRSRKKPAILTIAVMLLAGFGVAYFKKWIPVNGVLSHRSAMVASASTTKAAAAMSSKVSEAHATESTRAAKAGILSLPGPAGPKIDDSAPGTISPAEASAVNKVEVSAGQTENVPRVAASNPISVAPNSPAPQEADLGSKPTVLETYKGSGGLPRTVTQPAARNAVSKREILRPPVESKSLPSAAGEPSVFTAPKLVKALRPNSPAEALQGFISGNVVLDGIVDENGNVGAAQVITGPEKLRKAALEAVRQYKYEPAMQDGKPVSSHVKVTIQFWYEQ